MYVNIYIYIFTYIYIYIYMYKCIHIHTYISMLFCHFVSWDLQLFCFYISAALLEGLQSLMTGTRARMNIYSETNRENHFIMSPTFLFFIYKPGPP